MANSEKKSINLIQTAEGITDAIFGGMPGKSVGPKGGGSKSKKGAPSQKETRTLKKSRKSARTLPGKGGGRRP